jgi:hypothetical protein
LTVALWQKVSGMKEQLARQSADAIAQSMEARTLARQASDTVRDAAARVALIETRVAEVALQRSQLEELIQSLSRSRDENLVVDIESAVRLALQQAQVTGSVEPLLAALKAGDLRIARAAQPRLAAAARHAARRRPPAQQRQHRQRRGAAEARRADARRGRPAHAQRGGRARHRCQRLAGRADSRRCAVVEARAADGAREKPARWCASAASRAPRPCCWRPNSPTSCARTSSSSCSTRGCRCCRARSKPRAANWRR